MSLSYLNCIRKDEKPEIFTADDIRGAEPSNLERIFISFGSSQDKDSYLKRYPKAKFIEVKYEDFFDKSTKKMKDPQEILIPVILTATNSKGLTSLCNYITYVTGKANRKTKIKILGDCYAGLDYLGDFTSNPLDMTERYRTPISYNVEQVAQVIRAICDDSVSEKPTEDQPSMLKISLFACLSAKDSFPQKNNSFAERLAAHLYTGQSPVYCSVTGANKVINIIIGKNKYYGGDYGFYMKKLNKMVSFVIKTRIGIPLIIIPYIGIMLYELAITAEGYIHKKNHPKMKNDTLLSSNALRKTVFFPAKKEQDEKSTELVVKKASKIEYNEQTAARIRSLR